jgi:hypothetical protein
MDGRKNKKRGNHEKRVIHEKGNIGPGKGAIITTGKKEKTRPLHDP